MKNIGSLAFGLFVIGVFAVGGYSQEKLPCRWVTHWPGPAEPGRTMARAIFETSTGEKVTVTCSSRAAIEKAAGGGDAFEIKVKQTLAEVKKVHPDAKVDDDEIEGTYLGQLKTFQGKVILGVDAKHLVRTSVYATRDNIYTFTFTGVPGKDLWAYAYDAESNLKFFWPAEQ